MDKVFASWNNIKANPVVKRMATEMEMYSRQVVSFLTSLWMMSQSYFATFYLMFCTHLNYLEVPFPTEPPYILGVTYLIFWTIKLLVFPTWDMWFIHLKMLAALWSGLYIDKIFKCPLWLNIAPESTRKVILCLGLFILCDNIGAFSSFLIQVTMFCVILSQTLPIYKPTFANLQKSTCFVELKQF